MASTANTLSLHYILLILFSLSLQSHARESNFITKVIHYLSNAPKASSMLVPASAPVLVPKFVSMTESFFTPAPAPFEEEYGYGLYGQGSSEFSSEEYHASSLEDSHNESTEEEEEKATPVSEEFTSEKEAPFEKILSSESYSSSNNGYLNNVNGYSNSMNENNGYDQNGYNNNMNGYNQNGYNNGNDYNQNGYNNEYGYKYGYKNGVGYNHNGYNKGAGYNQNDYNNENGYYQNTYSINYKNNVNVNGYRSSMNGYKTDRSNQKNYNNYMSFTNENNDYNDNKYKGSKEESNGYNKYMVEQQGLSDTRFSENGKYSYDEGYYGNNGKSKYEFDTMEEYERQERYPESDQRGYVP